MSKPKVCVWVLDGDGMYYVRCLDMRVRDRWQRDADHLNNLKRFKFCPYCGGMIRWCA